MRKSIGFYGSSFRWVASVFIALLLSSLLVSCGKAAQQGETAQVEDNGRTWVNISDGLSQYNVAALAWDGIYLYAGCSSSLGANKGVWRYDGAAWTDTGGAVGAYYIEDLVSTGQNGYLYAATGGNGVWRYDGSSWTDTGGAIGGYAVYSLAWDGNNLWAGTEGQGIWAFSGGTWTVIAGQSSGDKFYSLAWGEDKLYAGTDGHGVWTYTPATQRWASIDSTAYSLDTVGALVWSGDKLYSGSIAYKGVWSYEGGAWKSTGDASPSRTNELVWDRARGELFAAADSGVSRYNGTQWSKTGGDIKYVAVYSLVLDANGQRLFAGTQGRGIWRY